jgi:hypothetical protein
MSDNTLKKGAADHGLRYLHRRRPLRPRLLDRVELAHEEGRVRRRCNGSPTRPRHREKNVRRCDEVVVRQFGKADKNKIRDNYKRAAYWDERVRLPQH